MDSGADYWTTSTPVAAPTLTAKPVDDDKPLSSAVNERSVFTLNEEQIHGAEFMQSSPVTMNADVPGFGKTAQAVHAFDCSGSSVGLVICPTILRANWAREFELWSFVGHRVTIIYNGNEPIPLSGVIVISYDVARQPHIRDALRDRGGDWLFIDEAHRLKDEKAKRTKSIFLADGIARNFKRVTWLTGTPAPNDASEFYTFLKSTGRWRGSKQAFISAFCETKSVSPEPDKELMARLTPPQQNAYRRKLAMIKKTVIVGNRNVAGLKELLAPVYLRRTEIKGLPELSIDVMPIEGSATNLTALEALTTPEVRAAIEAAMAAGDWQFFDTPHIASIRHLTGLAKADGSARLIIQELMDGEPAIVAFALHTAVIDSIAEKVRAAGFTVAVLDGRTPMDSKKKTPRQDMVDAFQRGDTHLQLCHSVTGGEGLTLIRSKRVIIAEPAWTPKDNDQPIARVWRRGQPFACRASFLALFQSLDDQVLSTLRRKKRLLAEIV